MIKEMSEYCDEKSETDVLFCELSSRFQEGEEEALEEMIGHSREYISKKRDFFVHDRHMRRGVNHNPDDIEACIISGYWKAAGSWDPEKSDHFLPYLWLRASGEVKDFEYLDHGRPSREKSDFLKKQRSLQDWTFDGAEFCTYSDIRGTQDSFIKEVDQKDQVRAVFDNLPKESQELLYLRYGKMMEIKEISKMLGKCDVMAWKYLKPVKEEIKKEISYDGTREDAIMFANNVRKVYEELNEDSFLSPIKREDNPDRC